MYNGRSGRRKPFFKRYFVFVYDIKHPSSVFLLICRYHFLHFFSYTFFKLPAKLAQNNDVKMQSKLVRIKV